MALFFLFDQQASEDVVQEVFISLWENAKNIEIKTELALDFKGNTVDPVRATASGEVVKAGIEGGYGNMVEIEHSHDFTTRYAHLSGFNVKLGDNVVAGQIIGYIGSTGRSTGAHLHYEVRRNEDALDPLPFISMGKRLE